MNDHRRVDGFAVHAFNVNMNHRDTNVNMNHRDTNVNMNHRDTIARKPY